METDDSENDVREGPGPSSTDLAETMETIGTGVIAVAPDFTVRWSNRAALEMIPELASGVDVHETLSRFTSIEKLDRLILRGELITCRCGPDQPETAWIKFERKLPDGGFVLMIWPSEWSDSLNQRRVAFTMAASHELRTPLTVLLGFAELLLLDREGLSPSQVETVAIIEQTSRHLQTLVDDIFDLTKNSFGELRLELEWTPVEAIVHSVVDSLRPQIEKRKQSLSLRIEPDLPRLEVDPARIRQIASNLVGNASVHNAAGTAVEVSLWQVGNGIELAIVDDGSGIGFDNPEDAVHSFHRGDSTGSNDGAGIGLTVAKRMVELHRGQLTLESAPGAGTAITVWLPLDRSTALADGEPGPA